MPRARLGVVLLVPEPARTEIDGLRRALGSGALGRIPPHITLVPPVNVHEARVGEVMEILRGAGGGAKPLHLRLGPVETFWPASPVVFAAVGGEDLEAVQWLRAAVTAGPLDRPSAQEFVPHVTLNDSVAPELIPAALELLGSYWAEVCLEAVHLLRQTKGQVWEVIGEARLAAPARSGRGGLEIEVSQTEGPDAQAAAWMAAAWAAYGKESYGEGAVEDRPFAFTARLAGRTAGVAVGSVVAIGTAWPSATLSRLIVGPSFRNLGVGTRLLAAAESLAGGAGCRTLRLIARAASPAERFYIGRGFVVRAGLAAWRAGQDFVVMERDLGAS